ncbi:Inner membrane ABC transporter permease protein YcjO [Blautia producta]|uniref:Inner membrane ABC transporter permease protein YcjO n=2 Tax=Blautia producta TaxID=33035 RepID=A0A4P6M089_9FIRM|nr:Inner membrane ABC transporter permease protein YcjO [Blautia producta]
MIYKILHIKKTRENTARMTAFWLLFPAVVFIILLIGYPLITVLEDAFMNKNLVNDSVSGFAGLDNFRKVISDEHFGQTVRNTIVWTIFSVLGEYLVGMVTAVLLNQKFRGRAIYRTLIFIPWCVPIVVSGLVWDWMLNANMGVVNYLLQNLHLISRPIQFLGNKDTAMASVIFVNIWRTFPYYTISFLAVLQSIPHDIIEASAIDGANAFQRFFKVILPQLKSISLVLVFMHIIWTAINFDFIWIMTEGGPNYATETIPVMIYRYSMKSFDVGAASALSTMVMAIMLILFLFYQKRRAKISAEML